MNSNLLNNYTAVLGWLGFMVPIPAILSVFNPTASIIVLVATFAIAIYSMLNIRSRHQQTTIEDSLKAWENIFVFLICFQSPIIIGPIFYFGFSTSLPQMAKQAKRLAFRALYMHIAIFFLFIILMGGR